jgi:hypothetical protein
MCRNIRTLFNYEPSVQDEEIRAAATQYVRKISGFRQPSQANQAAFEAAVEAISEASTVLLGSLVTKAPPKNRAEELARARDRNARRFSQ